MPGFVKTPKDEARWSKAKSAAAKSKGKTVESLKDNDFALANYIYHKMGKTEEDIKMAEVFKKSLTSVPGTGVPNAMKLPKTKSMPKMGDKPSMFLKSEGFEGIKKPSIEHLRFFLENQRQKK